jgi:beta-galactosidase
MIIGKPEFTERAQAFAKQGGTLVLTYRTAVKDVHNNLTFGAAIPVGYSEFAGVCVVETESLQQGQEFPLQGCGEMDGLTGVGGIFRDLLEVSDAQVLYRYQDTFYQEYAAVTCKAQGDGRVYYIGCGVDEDTMQTLMRRIMRENDITVLESADGVEICYRGDGANRIRMVMNHNGYAVEDGDTVLAPYESRIEVVADKQ